MYKEGLSLWITMKIFVKNQQSRIPVNSERVKKILRHVIKQEKYEGAAEITVCIVGDKKIRELNKAFLGKDFPTDVLAFNLANARNSLLADIIVSAETAGFYSGVFHTSPAYELYLYIIHGLLHVLGYDDATPEKRKKMHSRERYLYSTFSRKS